MKKEVGLWIDRQRAVIVINLDDEEEIKQITSNVGKHVRYSGASQPSDPAEAHFDTSENGRDRRFADELNRYYDEVIPYLRDASSILILGPSKAKDELQKRLVFHGFSGQVVTIKATDKLTNNQIIAEVRKYFRES